MEVVLKKIFYMFGVAYDFFRTVDKDVALAIWGKVLTGFHPKVIEAAATEWIARSQKAPTPADIRALCEVMQPTREKSVLAEKAWEQLIFAASQGLSWERVKQRFRKYPKVVRAVASIGYERIRLADKIKELPFVRRDFMLAYENYIEADGEPPFTQEAQKILGEVKKSLSEKKELPQ